MQKHVNHVDLVKSFLTIIWCHLLAKIGFDTAKNEPLKDWMRFNSFFQFTPYQHRRAAAPGQPLAVDEELGRREQLVGAQRCSASAVAEDHTARTQGVGKGPQLRGP